MSIVNLNQLEDPSPYTLDLWMAFLDQGAGAEPLPGVEVSHRIAILTSGHTSGSVRIPSIGSMFGATALVALFLTIMWIGILLTAIKGRGKINFKSVLALIWHTLISPQIFGARLRIRNWRRCQAIPYLILGFWMITHVPIFEFWKAFLYSKLAVDRKASIETLQDVIDRHHESGTDAYFDATHTEFTGRIQSSLDEQIMEVLKISNKFKEQGAHRGENSNLAFRWLPLIESGRLIYFCPIRRSWNYTRLPMPPTDSASLRIATFNPQ